MDTFDRISELLEKNSMTQSELSRATGISTGLISQWKKRMQSPSVDKLKKIADYFDVSVDYLLTGEENQKEAPKLNNVYLSFAMQAQNEGIAPEDIKLAIETIKKLRGE